LADSTQFRTSFRGSGHDGTALRLIGLNHGLLIGLAAGLISFIPYLGSLIGLVLSLCVVVLQF
jgi:predicted PurR-regulated permease PerM